MSTPKNIKTLQERSRDLRVMHLDLNTYVVESRSDPTNNHMVTVRFDQNGRTVQAQCTCEWSQFNGIACSHVLAALEYMASLKKRTLSFWTDRDSAKRQKHRLFQLVGRNDYKAQDGVWITSRGA